MLQACLNGGRGHPAPFTPEDIARSAAEAIAADADELHFHPRNAEGAESLAPADVAACLGAVRAAVPGVPVGIGTGAWIAPGGRARHAHFESWTERPDYVSVNLGEEDAPEVMNIMRAKGIGIEAGIWSQSDATRFAELGPPPVLRVLVEMPDTSPEAAADEAEAVIDLLPEGVPVLLHGDGATAWPMVAMAAERSLDTRIGLEDALHLPDGARASDNAALVRAARRILLAE